MIHLPEKRPWLILVGIYLIICLVWGTFMYLAKQNGTQTVSKDEAKELINR